MNESFGGQIAKEQAENGKFKNPLVTADGSQRARVDFVRQTTLWFNTGTLCNIECRNCYIESTPTNDRLVYITADEVSDYLWQMRELQWSVSEIGFTGGEPFMNPQIIAMIKRSLEAGLEVLVLSNAMRPMMRPRVQQGLIELNDRWPGKLCIRVSLDHYSEARHDLERGKGTFEKSLMGMDWLRDQKIRMMVAGRTIWGENDSESRRGYARLFSERGYDIDPFDPVATVLFPEITPTADVPEITSECWDILGVRPEDMMCSSSRMVVKRKGASHPSVVACTLLPYEPQFDFGRHLRDAEASIMLNNPACAQFCVLGGASCSRK
ncbi:MAG: radical SAM protein [Rhodobacteraceae bacterium]|nr:radical SAM protein [Paracoccaceae bacterium]